MDRIAENGLKFNNFYAGSTVCGPSMSSLMTGRHTGNTTIRGNWGIDENGKKCRIGLSDNDTMLSMMLKGAGYSTAMFGKWHLEEPLTPANWPNSKGFDYVPGEKIYSEAEKQVNKLNHDRAGYAFSINYIDDLFIDRSIHFIENNKENPFFIYLSLKTPHEPVEFIGVNPYINTGWPVSEQRYAARITCIDNGIGRWVEYLENKGLIQNILIIFTSDNINTLAQ